MAFKNLSIIGGISDFISIKLFIQIILIPRLAALLENVSVYKHSIDAKGKLFCGLQRKCLIPLDYHRVFNQIPKVQQTI